MKKFMKVCAILALIMVIVGVCLAVAAGSVAGTSTISQVVDSVTGGKVKMELDGLTNWGMEVSDKIVENLGGFDLNVNYDINDSSMFEDDYEILKGNVEKYCPGENVKKLDVEVGGCTFEMKNSEDGKIYIEVENAYKFQGFVEEETLHIKATIGSTTWNEMSDFKITLYLPGDYNFESVDFEVGAGMVKLQDLSAKKVEIEAGAGVINIDGMKAKAADCVVGAGQIEIQRMELEALELEVGMGECVAQGLLLGNVNVECAMGNVELKLDGSEKDFNYRLEGAMGNIDLGENSYSGLANERTVENGARKDMNVECAMGNITIIFTK